MSDGIFLLQDNGQVVDMRQQPFQSEEFLQHLIADHPELLAGDQFANSSPRCFLLISREMGLASEENGGDRWSIDHLFVDQDAILTVVEVKRSSDTRIRREVVGQMLDYASNAVVYLPIEQIRAKFERSHDLPEEQFRDVIGEEIDYDQFWDQVKTNLHANKIRLVFISDDIPQELRRIIEFLNGNMSSVEVLGIEIKQYVNDETGLKTLVPRVVGQTSDAQRVKRTYSTRTTTDPGDLRDSIVVQLSDVQYRIDQYMNYAVRVYDTSSGVEEKALPSLKRINKELELGVSETYPDGKARNTRQLGDWVIKELKQQGKFQN
jgi:hypothetical protein